MPHGNLLPLELTAHNRRDFASATARASRTVTPRPGKRARHTNCDNDMEIAEDEPKAGAARAAREGSDSSDWDDWADAMVAQGEPTDTELNAEEKDGDQGVAGTGCEGEEEAWVTSMIDQGTDRSVVQDADSRAWDYVLQMAVEEERSLQNAGGTVNVPVQEVIGPAATEFVRRWLGQSLPHASSALRTLEILDDAVNGQQDGRKSYGLRGRAIVDAIVEPSAMVVVTRSTTQNTPRIVLFSLSANAGAALAATVVQPGAAGLASRFDNSGSSCVRRDESPARHSWQNETSVEVSGDGTERSDTRGVVFESLDSRIAEDALTSAMGRLGLGMTYRSRSGVWRLSAGAELPGGARLATVDGLLTSLVVEDASDIACSSYLPGLTDRSAAEKVVQDIICSRRSAGIRRGGRLVAWCLSLVNGLAGPLFHHAGLETGVTERTRDDIVSVIYTLLADPVQGATLLGINARATSTTQVGPRSGTEPMQVLPGEEMQRRDVERVTRAHNTRGFVLDNDSYLVGLFREMGFERVCDADWVHFAKNVSTKNEPFGGCHASEEDEGGGQVVPFATLALHP